MTWECVDVTLRGTRRRSDGSIDLGNLSYAMDSYGRPVLCEYDVNERKFLRRKSPSKLGSSVDEDLLTREEKAARIRAEIARRRERLLNSESRARYPHSVDARDMYYEGVGDFVDDYDEAYEDEVLAVDDEFYDVEEPIGFRSSRLRPAPAFLSRSLDNVMDDYAFADAYEQDAHLILDPRGG